MGVFSSGVAYTLQILAQRDSDPTVVSLLLSLENPCLPRWPGPFFLRDQMSGREYFGCALVLAPVVLAQLPEPKRKEACPSSAEE